MSIEFYKTIPILRIFDVEKAKQFYCGKVRQGSGRAAGSPTITVD
jgi:hypothetical protein